MKPVCPKAAHERRPMIGTDIFLSRHMVMFATAPFGLGPPPHLEPTIGRHTSILITSTKDTDRVEWSMFCNLPCQNSQCSKRGMCMIKYALSKQFPGHFMQTDGS